MLGMSIPEFSTDGEPKPDDDSSKQGYEINESVLTTIKRGLAGIILTEDYEKCNPKPTKKIRLEIHETYQNEIFQS
jgi:hypothetical protein